MKKLLTAVVVGAALLIGAALSSSGGGNADEGTMVNCPGEGQWAISVWTGNTVDAGDALATCDNVVAAYTLNDDSTWSHLLEGIPEEFNTLDKLSNLDGVITLGGPATPPVPEPTNVSLFGTLPDDCSGLAMAVRSGGDGQSQARTGLHTEPLQIIAGTATKTWTQAAVVVEACLYCDGEFLQCADFPEVGGINHRYTVGVVVTGDDYEILPRQHEYMTFDCGKRPDGTIFVCRGYAGSKIPFNPSCPVRWEWHDDTGQICPGYPDAEFKARLCNPGETPVAGETYCLWYE